MMLYGVEQTITYTAWDTSANAGKTGDSANHTLRWVKNGTSSAPTNAASEVDATNAPGVYKITLTATEWETYQGTLAGKSSASGVVIVPQQFTTVRLPNAAPGASGGVALLGSLMGLTDDAITAAKYDESTAFPLKSADTGATAVSRLTAAAVNAEADTALSDVGLTTTVTGRIDAAVSTRSTVTEAQVNTQVDTALSDIGLDHLVAAAVAGTDITDDSIIAKLVSRDTTADWDDYDNTTDSLQALRDRGDSAWTTGATSADVTDAVTAIRGATGTETLDTLAVDIAAISAGTAPTVEQIDAELTANHGAGLWTASAAGSGDTQVDHDTLDDDGDALTFIVGGSGISGATVRAYVTTEYAAGTYTVRGSTRTVDNGEWEAPLMLNAGIQYTIEYYRPGYELATTTVTVT